MLRLEKHSISIRGHRTSVTLEAPFWTAFRELAAAEGLTLGEMAARIDAERLQEGELNLSSAIRVRALRAAQKQAQQRAQQRAQECGGGGLGGS